MSDSAGALGIGKLCRYNGSWPQDPDSIERREDPSGGRMGAPLRSEIRAGLRVQIVEKENQRTGALTDGVVARILTNSPTHPHGIKVMLEGGKVGRVQVIVDEES